MNNALKIVSFVLLGAILCAILSGACWYYAVYNYYEPGANPGIGSSKDFSAVIIAIFGVVWGCVGGLILSSVIAIIGIPRVPSFFIGAFINGLTPILFLLLVLESDVGEIFSDSKDYWLSFLGQFLIGGMIGLLVSVLAHIRENPSN